MKARNAFLRNKFNRSYIEITVHGVFPVGKFYNKRTLW